MGLQDAFRKSKMICSRLEYFKILLTVRMAKIEDRVFVINLVLFANFWRTLKNFSKSANMLVKLEKSSQAYLQILHKVQLVAVLHLLHFNLQPLQVENMVGLEARISSNMEGSLLVGLLANMEETQMKTK